MKARYAPAPPAMLTHDVRFDGFDTSDWSRLVSTFRPLRVGDPAVSDGEGGVVAVHSDGQLKKLLHTTRGRLDPSSVRWPLPLAQLAQGAGAAWALSADTSAGGELAERFGGRARRDDDWTAQALSLGTIYRELLAENRVQVWPPRFEKWLFPSPAVLTRTLDVICGNGQVVLVGVFHEGALFTSIALKRQGRAFSDIVGPCELREQMGLLAGDFRRDYRHLVRTVEQEIGPLALGCFAELETLHALEVDPSPGAWARAVAVRDIILAPSPVALAIPLAIDASRAVFQSIRLLLERWRAK